MTKRQRLFTSLFSVFVCLVTIGYFAWFGRWSFYRFAFSLRDFVFAIGKYFLVVFGFSGTRIPGVISDIPDIPFVPFLPVDPSDLSGFWKRFGAALFDRERFLLYNLRILIWFIRAQRFLLPVLILVFALKTWLSGIADDVNDDFGKKSKAVRAVEAVQRKVFAPVRTFLSLWWSSVPFWLVLSWCIFVLAGVNLLTILIEIIASLFWFSVSSDFSLIYRGIYKLLLDLTVTFSTLPAIVWIVIAYLIYTVIRRAVAYRRLERMEAANRVFIEKLPLCVLITGKIGVGKTTTNVNLSLSLQDAMRDRLLSSMMEIQAEFPFYPWELFDRQIGIMFFCGDLPSKAATRSVFSNPDFEEYLFLYDYKGKRVFDDGVNVKHIEDRIVDYAEIQVMYRQQTLLFSSYSMRTDNLFSDLGKMPLWSSDYFRVPAFDPWCDSIRSHILDFNLLRLGKTVSGEPGGAWEYGICSHTEMGKDFGNALTNKDLKATDDRANIKNDLLIDRIKILRHSATADHHPFAQYIGDEQRPTSLGADALELCDVVRLIDASKNKKTIHLLLIEQFLIDLLNSIWSGWYVRRRVHRADEDLPTWILRRLMNRFHSWDQKTQQLFGYQEISCVVQDGSDLDADGKPDVIYSCFKKVHSDRFSTDCFAGVLASRAFDSEWSMQTARSYAGSVATPDEIRVQHSYFGDKVLKIGGEEDDEPADGD